MSVIVTGMDVPKNCKECELVYVDMCGEDCCCILGDDISTKDRLKNCPLKSVEGLVEKIEVLAESIKSMRADGQCFFTPEEIIRIINKYCEVKE